ncbi:DNA helicase B [Acipenser ruthenus]|uniref:DNA helicase B n=1 Tax=Acipenser ruthenus TaxID=7906 RepID=A0A662YQ81_ACIRT|nr:DNA helicase B [Acipenser ruthenus]
MMCAKTTVVSLIFQAAVKSLHREEEEEVQRACKDFENDLSASEDWDMFTQNPSQPREQSAQDSGSKKPLEVLLTAPTGRAASLLQKRTGFEGYTLHQVLWSYMKAEKDEEGNPLNWKFSAVQIFVVDEGSLVSVQILYSVLSMLMEHAQLRKLVILETYQRERSGSSISPDQIIKQTSAIYYWKTEEKITNLKRRVNSANLAHNDNKLGDLNIDKGKVRNAQTSQELVEHSEVDKGLATQASTEPSTEAESKRLDRIQLMKVEQHCETQSAHHFKQQHAAAHKLYDDGSSEEQPSSTVRCQNHVDSPRPEKHRVPRIYISMEGREKLEEAGSVAQKLEEAGSVAQKLEEAGSVAQKLEEAGSVAQKLEEAGSVAQKLEEAGSVAQKLEEAGSVAQKLEEAGSVAQKLEEAGSVAQKLEEAGSVAQKLEEAGSVAQKLEEAGSVAQKLEEAGSVAQKLEEAGSVAQKLEEAGSVAQKLEEAGSVAQKLEEAGSVAQKLEEAGSVAQKLEEAGSVAQKLEEAGSVAQKLEEAGSVAQKLEEAGSVAQKLEEAGSVAQKLEEAGSVAQKLEEAGSVAQKLEEAGSVAQKLEEARSVAQKLDEAGSAPLP